MYLTINLNIKTVTNKLYIYIHQITSFIDNLPHIYDNLLFVTVTSQPTVAPNKATTVAETSTNKSIKAII